MNAILRAGILGIMILGAVGCAMDDESIEDEAVIDIELAPDVIVDPTTGSGSQSGALSCGPLPAGGSDPTTLPYSADKEGDCCWHNYVQKTYKRYQTRYLMCMY